MKAAFALAVLSSMVGCSQNIETSSYEGCVDGMCTCQQSARVCCDPNICGYDDDNACSRVCEAGLPLQGVIDFDIGDDNWCYINADGVLACEEIIVSRREVSAPEGSFRAVSAADGYGCAVATSGALVCWEFEVGAFQEYGSDFVDVRASSIFNVNGSINSACGLHIDGSIECFGPSPCGGSGPPAGVFRELADGDPFCALDMQGELSCWECQGALQPPPGPWAEATVGLDFCGRHEDGTLDCDRIDEPAPAGVFLAAKPHCGIRANGWLQCWNAEPQPLPIGAFVDLDTDATGETGCGLRDTGELACWGELEE